MANDPDDDLDFSGLDMDTALNGDFSFEFEEEPAEPAESDLELEQYPKFYPIEPGASALFLENFLVSVKDDYETTGFGSYKFTLNWNFIPDEAHVTRFLSAVRTMLSNVRREMPVEKRNFKFMQVEIRMFPGSRVAYVEMARVTENLFNQIMVEKREQRQKNSNSKRLADLA